VRDPDQVADGEDAGHPVSLHDRQVPEAPVAEDVERRGDGVCGSQSHWVARHHLVDAG
jgi:hypothetical protein